ncbi:SDR family oxidoreductase [Cryobacterium sp. GrIS_2_6]|uniref:SDR family oxidoreductase n=1 Tax=Cryobacterium sp. GrIS_2_6 TaxID=3162785 RepID=UPI0034DDAF34
MINFSTSVTRTQFPGYGAYVASKAAVESITLILARELRGKDVTVNAVAPGPTATALFLNGKDEATITNLASAVPLERLGQPADIAETVAFLAGPERERDRQPRHERTVEPAEIAGGHRVEHQVVHRQDRGSRDRHLQRGHREEHEGLTALSPHVSSPDPQAIGQGRSNGHTHSYYAQAIAPPTDARHEESQCPRRSSGSRSPSRRTTRRRPTTCGCS